jgi:hypothetical protein
MLAALDELVLFVAGLLDGTDDASLQDWLTDKDLAGHLQVEGDRLRQTATRVALLRTRVAAALVAQDTPGRHQRHSLTPLRQHRTWPKCGGTGGG